MNIIYAHEADPAKCTASHPTYDTYAEALDAASAPALNRPGVPKLRILRGVHAPGLGTAWEPVGEDACPGCGRPAHMGCHDLCEADTPQLTADEIGVAPW